MDDQDQGENSTAEITVALPTVLLTEIDEVVPTRYADRDDFIREAVRRYLEHLRTTKIAA
jgi:metal-responsive CopG/Arc/MetJ family transcriptional regulator